MGATNRKGFPAEITVFDASDLQGIVDKPNGGLGIDASQMAIPMVQYQRALINSIQGDIQFPQAVAYSPTNYLEENPVYALRYAWPTSHRYIAFLEVQINQPVSTDEDFEVEVFGCVYGGSGLLSGTALSSLDGASANKLVFSAGTSATKRTIVLYLSQIGGTQITHVCPRVRRTGANTYPWELSIFLYSAP